MISDKAPLIFVIVDVFYFRIIYSLTGKIRQLSKFETFSMAMIINVLIINLCAIR
jgi:hypothetical protein